jgi:hypothetical protein
MRLPAFTSLDKTDDEEDEEDAAYRRWKNQPQTPTIAESAQQLRRSLSVHGLHELANMPPAQIRRQVGSKIWRSQDEVVKMPSDWERLAVHLIRSGLRSFNLAFMLRGSVMLVFALIRAIRTKKAQGKAFLLAVFGAENIRFGLMFAAWSVLYKAAHNSLRLITPMPESIVTRERRAKSVPGSSSNEKAAAMSRTSSSGAVDTSISTPGDGEVDSGAASGTATPRSGYHELEGKTGKEWSKAKAQQQRRAFMRDPRSRIWHAYVAGAVSGLAILVEKKDSRINLAQQLLVRGLEGTYNSAHSKGLISIPNGAILTFGLACGQIMYAWLNAPQTLPRGYISWITQASHIAPRATNIHRDIMAGKTPQNLDENLLAFFPDGKIPTPSILSDGRERFPNIAPNKVNRRGITSENAKKLRDFLTQTKEGQKRAHVPCELVHPWENSHVWSPVDRFIEVTRWILPVYMTLHFVPAVFLRMRAFKKDPIRVFLRSLFGSIRSSSFLGMFVIIFQTLFCSFHSLHDRIANDPTLSALVPQWAQQALVSTGMHWFAGFSTCASLFLEHKKRRTELAMYVLPKGMESAWSVARQRSWVPFVPGGDLLLTSAGMSLVMGSYAHNPEHLSGIVRRIVYQFVGRN